MPNNIIHAAKEKLHCHGRAPQLLKVLFAFGIVWEQKEQQDLGCVQTAKLIFAQQSVLYVRVHAAHGWKKKHRPLEIRAPLAQVRSSSMEFFIVSTAVYVFYL